MAGNFVDHNPTRDQKPGVQGLVDSHKGFIAAFDDIKVNPELVIAKGDYVTVYIRQSAHPNRRFLWRRGHQEADRFHVN